MQNEQPLADEGVQVQSSWRYAALFSFFVTVPLWLMATLWVRVRDNVYPNVGEMLVIWAFAFVVLMLAIKWDGGRR